MTARLARLIREFDAAQPKWLSLDVFDTVLFRPFERPTDVFIEVHRALQLAGERVAVDPHAYAVLRCEAEHAARQEQSSGEVTLEELSHHLSRALGSSTSREALVATEVATERRFIQMDPDVAALILHAHARSIPYVLVSDMYLSGEQILSLLDAASSTLGTTLPAPAHVFVSSERRTNKGSWMFDEVVRQLDCPPADIFHIGDHQHSDFESPRRRGLRAFHYHRETPYVTEVLELENRYIPPSAHSHYDLGLRTIRSKALTSAQTSADAPLDHFQYGAFILGPVLTLFAEWVVEDCVRNAQRTVFCLMREGHLLQPLIERAAQSMGVSLRVEKLWASRYAIRGASYHYANEPELRSYFVKRHNLPLTSAARDLGLELQTLRRLTGIAHNTALTDSEVDAVVSSVMNNAELRAQMLDTSAEKRRRLFAYFESVGVFADERLSLVDLGWGGTIQATLARVFRGLQRPQHVRGLYLATHEKLFDLPLGSCSADSFLFQLGEPRVTCDILRRSPEILEHSCMPELGSFEGIDDDGSVRTFPQPIAPAQLRQIGEMQAGIMHFAELWLPGARARRRELTHNDWNGVLERLRAHVARSLDAPTVEEARLFEGWHHDNNDGSSDTEPLLGSAEQRHRAQFMTYDQIMQLTWHESFWPQGLARLVGRDRSESKLWRAMLRYPAVRNGASLLSRSAAAVSRGLLKAK